jgi:hypothetical protein
MKVWIVMTDLFRKPLVSLCCLLGAAGCGRQQVGTVTVPQHTNYYFQMDAATLARFQTAIGGVTVGETRERVVAALGRPDHDQDLTTKDGRFVARVLTYYAGLWEKDLVSEGKDRLVRLEFDAKGRLDRIVSNVDGIPSRGNVRE